MAVTSRTQFGRSCVLTVGQPGAPSRSWDGLRVTFTVELTGSREPNTAEVEVYGLTRDSSAACREAGAVVQLVAGYAAPGRLFLGGIDRAVRTDNGRDAVTRIEASDGGRSFREGRISKTFSGEVNARRVMEELATAAGVPLGFVGDFDDIRISTGLTLNGPVRDGLDRLARMVGAEWSLQDGALQLLSTGQTTQEEAPLLSPDSGLIGSPTPVKDAKTDGKIEIVSLLLPTMRPGRRLQLESRDFKGVYKAEKVTHRGDTHGQDWYTVITARAV